MREDNIKSVSNAIQSHDETIALLQKQKQKYSSVEKYLGAAEINKINLRNDGAEAAESERARKVE